MRNPGIEKQICDAIKKHLVIRFRYQGQTYYRTFEPYVIYYSPKDNNEILLGGTQTKDDSEPAKGRIPRKFNLEEISFLTVTDDTFNYDARFDPTRDEYRNGVICIIKRDKVV